MHLARMRFTLRQATGVVALAAFGLGVWNCTDPPPRVVPTAAPGEAPLFAADTLHDISPDPPCPPPVDDGGLSLWEAARGRLDTTIPPAPPTDGGETRGTRSGVRYRTLRPGGGEAAKVGQLATVRYVGRFPDGRVFDDGSGRPAPIRFVPGAGQVIAGLEEGVPGMRVGEVRRLIVPPAAGYGSQGSRDRIPPDATLVFEVELVGLKFAPANAPHDSVTPAHRSAAGAE